MRTHDLKRVTPTEAGKYSPFRPYFSKLTLTCSWVSPVFSFTPKWSKTSVADLVCAFSMVVGLVDDLLQMHVVQANQLGCRKGCEGCVGGGGGGRCEQQLSPVKDARGLSATWTPWRKTSGSSAAQTRLSFCSSPAAAAAAATSSPPEGVVCLCWRRPPSRCWALPPVRWLAARTWAHGFAASCSL